MLLSLNRRWDLRKHGARPRNPRQEEPLPSTALLADTVIQAVQVHHHHSAHRKMVLQACSASEKKNNNCILKYEFLQQGDSLREVGWNKPTRAQWSACLGKMMTYLHTQGFVGPLIQSSATDRVT